MKTLEKFALDLKSARSYDADGRLHVALSNISKANVCPYYGEEIPGCDALGLDPGKVYQLLRDPKELEQGAATANGIQLLSMHLAVSAGEPQKQVIAGTTGTNAVFNAPYLQNSLIVWNADDIRNIENGSVKELSCGYRYRPDMTPGVYEGIAYDGVMREIVFNHIALVKEGRAGADVVVADRSINIKEQEMSKSKQLSLAAVMVQGALTACLRPKLAADQQFDVAPLLAGVTKANWHETRKVVADGLKNGLKGRLDKNTDIDEIIQLLDALKSDDMADDDDPEAGNGADPAAMDDETDASGVLSSTLAKIVDMLKACLPKSGAQDDPSTFPGKPDAGGAEDKDAKNGEKIDKKAMDAAIRLAADKAAKDAEERTIARLRGIAEAEKTVKPYVGRLAIAADSAEGVYKAALDTLGVDVKGVHASAYKAILQAQAKPSEVRHAPALAADGAPKNIFELCPDLTRLS